MGDFDGPTYATGAPGDASRVFVVEKPGRIRLVRDGAVLAQPFLDVSSMTLSADEERGLLSAAFAPDYATSGKFYVYLTARPDGALQIWEYTRSAANPDVADASSGRLLLAIPHADAANHNGGQLQFGPDGKLWLGTGDGGGGNDQFGHSQDPASLLGKLIRLDPASPAPEIVARGLRNPWRFSFDRASGQLVVGDVGQDAWEEIDVGVAANYGWPCFEGTARGPSSPASCMSGATLPVLTKSHADDGFCSITGGYVVRDPGLPTLAGRYLYGDFCNAALRSVDLAAPASDAAVGLSVNSLSSFGEDTCGRILVVSLAGPVYRLVDGALSACQSSAPGPTAPPPDTRACVLSARVTGMRSLRRTRRLTVALRTDEACTAVVSARVRGVASFRGARVGLERGKRTVVRVRLTTRGARALRRALRHHTSVRVAVTVRATDAAGNVARLSPTVKVRR
ncbi:PQQ-dependent sugar dehydrogenase [Solirubrobacter soli]|uniref:PQQ-dependent sugar dehydrogenase n=1 Tax=Solirubrobacter soli TaxID=363832 RepID=UPI00069E737F|nr:PQQ-dependent sugar dehydrogenase [Solirubrobacter soli]